ncbi:hypothetical protein H2198_005313 [Neophaeococcomyces mojaviensis]|uniref:Uncharacterized protein n=1 Tax=Neophaeococcomyces mojaviensis TaxID=3383035 RepID=A0ACC3A649_9EURO|nr:hypothetical protein H2198_005313 [Knufia sp. JES_112]
MTAASSDRSVSNYLLSSAHGSIVIASRSREVAEGLLEYAEDVFDRGALRRDDAIALLIKGFKRGERDTD